jgi:hypothetical protein
MDLWKALWVDTARFSPRSSWSTLKASPQNKRAPALVVHHRLAFVVAADVVQRQAGPELQASS